MSLSVGALETRFCRMHVLVPSGFLSIYYGVLLQTVTLHCGLQNAGPEG
jgi:hypothetical protein